MHTKEIAFAKFQGAGNDFIIIEDLLEEFPLEDLLLIRKLCHRQLGVGADGLILIRPSSDADYRMCFFNQDGAVAKMCGNGLRCLVRYIHERLSAKNPLHIASEYGVHACLVKEEQVTTELGAPKIHAVSQELPGGYRGHLLDTGVPHAVIFVPHLEEESFIEKSRKIRYHPSFAPEGVNVNFGCVTPEGKISLRTYERGVEDETLACGTGAAAVAVMGRLLYGLQSPIALICQSQDQLLCHLEEIEGKIKNIFLEGPAKHVFDGKVALYSL